MIVEGKELYLIRGEQTVLDVEFTDEDGNVAEIQSSKVQIFTIDTNEVVYTANSLTVDVTGLDAGVYWYQIDVDTTLGRGRIGPARLYVLEGKE